MRPRALRRRLTLAAFGAIITGATLGTGIAKASPDVCGALDSSPSVGTVENLVVAFVNDGWSPEESGELIARVVLTVCPEHGVVLQRFIAAWAPVGSVVA